MKIDVALLVCFVKKIIVFNIVRMFTKLKYIDIFVGNGGDSQWIVIRI